MHWLKISPMGIELAPHLVRAQSSWKYNNNNNNNNNNNINNNNNNNKSNNIVFVLMVWSLLPNALRPS